MGRPTKLTPEASAAVLAAVSAGLPRHLAAHAAGVDRSTLLRWLAEGRRAESGPCRDLRDALKKAEAVGVATRIARIADAGVAGTWQADAWYLERVHGDIFGTNARELKRLRQAVAALEKLVRGNQGGRDDR